MKTILKSLAIPACIFSVYCVVKYSKNKKMYHKVIMNGELDNIKNRVYQMKSDGIVLY